MVRFLRTNPQGAAAADAVDADAAVAVLRNVRRVIDKRNQPVRKDGTDE